VNRLGDDTPHLNVELRFRCLDDFAPARIASQVEPLRKLLAERSELVARLAVAEADGSIDDRELASFHASAAKIDALLSAQLNEIMHSSPFQRLEATWRGLHFLATLTETGSQLELHVLDVSKRELSRDLTRAVSFDQSALFKHVYEQEYGTFGGRAFGVLIGDYEIGPEPTDLHLLGQISHVAAAAHAPFVAAAAPTLFGIDSFGDLGEPRALSHIFDTVEYAQWRSFRESEDAQYVALVLPRILLRRPFGDSNPVEAFDFQERVERHDEWLWGNAAYALGVCITNAFAKYHWCAAIRGVEGGGLVEGLPTGSFMTEYGEAAAKCPVEIALSDRREVELAQLGFIPLLHVKGTDHAVFFSMQTCAKPRAYDIVTADANARLSTQLQYVLTTSRFAHYLKQMVRDRLRNFVSRADCEDFLNRWLSRYVAPEDQLSIVNKAKFPLREAHVDVTEVPGKPGAYRAVAFLRPNFQLEELSVSMRVVVELARP
jgi:type VI secretion system protein ImpC